jgi:hypothetical protein
MVKSLSGPRSVHLLGLLIEEQRAPGLDQFAIKKYFT